MTMFGVNLSKLPDAEDFSARRGIGFRCLSQGIEKQFLMRSERSPASPQGLVVGLLKDPPFSPLISRSLPERALDLLEHDILAPIIEATTYG